MMAVKKFAIILFVCWLSTFYCDARPSDDKQHHTNPIDVHDTDDEFVIKKPQSEDPKYTDFLDELYKHDNEKQPSKSKRDLSKAALRV